MLSINKKKTKNTEKENERKEKKWNETENELIIQFKLNWIVKIENLQAIIIRLGNTKKEQRKLCSYTCMHARSLASYKNKSSWHLICCTIINSRQLCYCLCFSSFVREHNVGRVNHFECDMVWCWCVLVNNIKTLGPINWFTLISFQDLYLTLKN